MIGKIDAERGDVGPMAALKQSDEVIRRQSSLSSVIIGQWVRCYCKWQVVWRLTTRVFDLVPIGEISIVTFGVGIFTKMAEASCPNLAVFND